MNGIAKLEAQLTKQVAELRRELERVRGITDDDIKNAIFMTYTVSDMCKAIHALYNQKDKK